MFPCPTVYGPLDTSSPCNSFYCLGHCTNVYDDDDDASTTLFSLVSLAANILPHFNPDWFYLLVLAHFWVARQPSGWRAGLGRGFESQSRRCRVTVLGKLFTPIVPLFTKQRNW